MDEWTGKSTAVFFTASEEADVGRAPLRLWPQLEARQLSPLSGSHMQKVRQEMRYGKLAADLA